MKLINKSQRPVTQFASFFFIDGRYILSHDADIAAGWGIQATQHMQQRTFSGTRYTHNRKRFTRQDIQVYAHEHWNLQFSLKITLAQVTAGNYGFIHTAAPLRD